MRDDGNLSGFLALLRREWREDWVFLLATGLLVVAGRLMQPPFSRPALFLLLAALASGLVLGVRAFAPDAANGTARFIRALPAAGRTVLAAKLTWRFGIIALATVPRELMVGGEVLSPPSLLGAAVLVACLAGVVTGWLLEQPTTAFAAGATVLVALSQAGYGFAPLGVEEAGFGDWAMLAAGLAVACLVLLGLLRWLVGKQ